MLALPQTLLEDRRRRRSLTLRIGWRKALGIALLGLAVVLALFWGVRLVGPGLSNATQAKARASAVFGPLQRSPQSPSTIALTQGGPAESQPYATPRDLYSRGLRELDSGHPSNAIAILEEVATRAASDPLVQNDLAVAYLERGLEKNRPLDLILALDAANRALELAPEFAQARFNRAVCLTRLHLRRQARSAWRSCLDLDAEFAAVARKQLRSLNTPSLAERWTKARVRLETAVSQGDHDTVVEIVSDFRHLARVAAEEEGLSAWGEALMAGSETIAAKRLTRVKAIGDALLKTTGDAMIRDTVEVIQRVEGHPDRLRKLAAGHRAFGRGLRLYRNQSGSAGRTALIEAGRLLATENSPFALWARFYATTADHYSNPAGALAGFLEMQSTIDSGRYPVLAGLTAWMLGTVENNLGHPERALAAFTIARQQLASTAAPETSGFVHTLRAEAYERLGEILPAWRERIAALAAAADGGDPRRVHATLHEAIEATQHIAPSVALEFQNELLENNRNWPNAGALTETYLLMGRTLSLLGRQDEALSAFRHAQAAASTLGAGGQSDRIAIEVALAEGEALANSNPSRALSSLTMALHDAARQSFFFQTTRLLTVRANVLLRLGDEQGAESDLQKAIVEHERVRSGLEDGRLQVSYFEGAQTTFDAMIRLQVVKRREPERGLEFAERARARQLLDLVGTQSSAFPRPLEATELLARMPAEATLVEYAVLPERLLVWILRRGHLDFVDIPISKKDLQGKVRALRLALARSASATELHRASAEVHHVLLRPLLQYLPQGEPLVFVPDRFLIEVPFAVLFDSLSGRYLIEDHVLAIAPSATLYLTGLARAQDFVGTPWSALAIGDPAFDRNLHPSLRRLEQAVQEAREVAALYHPEADLLLAAAATRDAFLERAGMYRVLHFGGHALLDSNSPRSNRLLLASSDSLTAEEVAALRLEETEVVVLSSCRTLPGGGMRESVSGLAAAFLAAGPAVVISSLWETKDRAARFLLVGFHEHLRRGESPASALRKTQLQLLHGTSASLRSPAAWGGFEAIGGAVGNQ